MTRRTFPFQAYGITSIERSISRETRSTFFFTVTAALRRRKRCVRDRRIVHNARQQRTGHLLGQVMARLGYLANLDGPTPAHPPRIGA